MKRKEQITTLKKEVGLNIQIPMSLTPICVIVFNVAYIYGQHSEVLGVFKRLVAGKYELEVLGVIIVLYLGLQEIFMVIIRAYAKREMLVQDMTKM